MSFRELLETSQAIALADKLHPTEVSIWHRYCREFSKKFNVSLVETLKLDPEFVFTQVYSDQLSDWEPEEQIDNIRDLLGSLSDPDYDASKERAYREEMQQILEEEKERLEEGRAIHESLEKKTFGEKPKEQNKELPKSGGINMNLINQLRDENEK